MSTAIHTRQFNLVIHVIFPVVQVTWLFLLVVFRICPSPSGISKATCYKWNFEFARWKAPRNHSLVHSLNGFET